MLCPADWRNRCNTSRSMSLLFEALRDLAELALGCSNCRTLEAEESGPASTEPGSPMGGLVLVSGTGAALHVGVLAAPGDCARLARRLLGQPASGHFPPSIVRGAMCELAYLLGGGVKRRLNQVGELSVGAPEFFEGTVQSHSGWVTSLTHVDLDHIRATLVSVARRDSAELL
jgi:hypothetical protein